MKRPARRTSRRAFLTLTRHIFRPTIFELPFRNLRNLARTLRRSFLRKPLSDVSSEGISLLLQSRSSSFAWRRFADSATEKNYLVVDDVDVAVATVDVAFIDVDVDVGVGEKISSKDAVDVGARYVT